MTLQCQADIQEELDKQSISLIGYREAPSLGGAGGDHLGSRVSSPQNQPVQLDSKCLNCQNNA